MSPTERYAKRTISVLRERFIPDARTLPVTVSKRVGDVLTCENSCSLREHVWYEHAFPVQKKTAYPNFCTTPH